MSLAPRKPPMSCFRSVIGIVYVLSVRGCVPPIDPSGGNSGDGDGSLSQVAAVIAAGEPHDTWALAFAVPLPADGKISISGTIDADNEVDVIDLGTVAAGDHIVVETTQRAGLDAAAGLFGPGGMMLVINDDRNYSRGMYDPFIDHIVREDLPHCYLVIAASPAQPSTGSYTLAVERHPNAVVPQPHGQAVLLDFDGATGVQIGSRASVNVPAFNAADIDPTYAGQTGQIEEIIESMVAEEYAPYDVDVYSTADGDNPSGPVTHVYFGTGDPALLGLADWVDAYNANASDDCIVFTDTFRLFMPLNPTVQQMGTALANVAAHELGHLLGLRHTKDPAEVMDITGSARSLLADQTLHVAPLEDSVFPIGSQDARMLLMDALGPHQ